MNTPESPRTAKPDQPRTAMPDREAAAIVRLRARSRASIALGSLLALAGAAGVVWAATGLRSMPGWIAVVCGASIVGIAVRHLRLLARARETLSVPPRRLALDRRHDLGARCGWSTSLWADGSRERPLARFGFDQSCAPMFMRTDGPVPALVYGAPTPGAALAPGVVLVVSCADGVLIGRVGVR